MHLRKVKKKKTSRGEGDAIKINGSGRTSLLEPVYK